MMMGVWKCWLCEEAAQLKEHSKGMIPFGLLVIDAAAHLKECETLIPLQLLGIQHAVLIGDEHQLPATIISKVRVLVLILRFLELEIVNDGVAVENDFLQYFCHCT
ncbi:hypothetical protein GIB67_004824 [Kingdonia uniflora]|uniref:DNA2/NAM7 helicase helicase domain-containing protein n=1 Tax=Kingdonia uniflora TaxID=39325 RepID=A0A7J7LNA6_9MAGN|nr:hypothetical protein GIB67_004824 [Kingdonia uniflora]